MTADASGSRRGQPLIVLVGLLLGWVALRIVLWQPPFELGDRRFIAEGSFADRAGAAGRDRTLKKVGDAAGELPAPPVDDAQMPDGHWQPLNRPLPGLVPAPVPGQQISRRERAGTWQAPYASPPMRTSAAAGLEAPRVRMAVGHAVLAMMGLSRMEVPAAIAAYLGLARRHERDAALAARPGVPQAAREPFALGLADPGRPGTRGWTGDAWLLLREDSAAPLVAGQPSYGRSQAGAVLRYRLAPSSGHRPQAYVRASAALERPRDAEIAGGLSARPLAGIPLRLAAELRVSDTSGGTDLRPAAIAVTEFPPLDLPLGTRGEAYVQGGYVGGDFATPFVDGQLRVTREVARFGDSGLSAGAGAWGGAQENASRLDIGPSAALSFRLGEVNSRVAVDYRVRIAGEAEPASGPALTLSAGF